MTSPQQPQPQPQPQPAPESGGQPMPPTAGPMPPASPQPAAGQPAPQQPSPEPSTPFEQGGSPSTGEAGTMMLQAQPQPGPGPGPAKEAGTMLLQAQPPAGGHPEPRPLSAHGPGRSGNEPGTMMLTVPASQPQPQPQQAQQPPQAPAPQQQPPHPQQPPAAPNWQAAGAGYVSPIPVRPTHLGHALAAEWTKIRSVRSTMWTLGVMVALIVGIGLLTATALSGHRVGLGISYGFFSVLLGTLCIIPLGVLVISSEYGTGMIRTTMTACPSRARVLAAKAIVFFLLAFVITTLTTTLVTLALSGMLDSREPTLDEWLRCTVGAGLYVSMLGLLAMAVGSLLRHSAGAISAMFGVVLLPMLLAVFMLGSSSLQWLAKGLITYSVPNALATLYGMPFLGTGEGPQGWGPLGILTGVAAVALGAAFVVQERRDV
ncbi:ABC transporter permease subunit [Streptomyces sp. NPDC020883]|uniref:ABC transporter permease subunit n=1 Tax=Streptomyces sp. NPDC020883 TaxID=3365099 RepID=UPI0037BC5659